MTRDGRVVRELVGRIVGFGFSGTQVNERARKLVRDMRVGMIPLFSHNLEDATQAVKLAGDLQELALGAGREAPLLLAADQENGTVRRLPGDFVRFPGHMALAAANDPAFTGAIGRATGQQLRAVGINMDLAPVLDVNIDPDNPVIGVRSFGEEPQRVAAQGTAFIRGLQEAGVFACAKHFPGHGDTKVDSHLGLPRVASGRARLEAVELAPFRAAIAAGVDALMTAHVAYGALDDSGLPATLSRRIITGLLRTEMGFSGVVVTDSMGMKAIADGVGPARGAVMALAAGCDLILVGHGEERQQAVYRALVEAVETGAVPFARLEEAAGRVTGLRRRLVGRPAAIPLTAAALTVHDRLARVAGYRAVTVIHGREALPLQLRPGEALGLLQFVGPDAVHGAVEHAEGGAFAAELLQIWPAVVRLFAPPEGAGDSAAELNWAASTETLRDVRFVIVELPSAADGRVRSVLDAMVRLDKVVIGYAGRSPYAAGRLTQLARRVSPHTTRLRRRLRRRRAC